MAIVPETGAIVPNANSYVSVAQADAYFEARNNAVWAALSDENKEAALLYAAQWVDARYMWPGTLVDDTQVMAWPRYGAYDSEMRSLSTTSIPQLLKDAQCEAALAHVATVLNEIRDRGGAIQEVEVDVLRVLFAKNAPGGRTFPYIDAILYRIASPFSTGILTTFR